MAKDAEWVESMPERYERGLGAALFGPYARELADRAAELAPRTVLEIAAGTGIVTAELARTLPDADIVATDLNAAMVEFGSARVPSAQWRVADAEHLGVDDDSVDLLVCQFGVMFFPDRPASFAEARRVLRAQGTYLFAVWDEVHSSELSGAVTDALAELQPDDPPTFLSRVPYGYHDPDTIRAELAAGGLRAAAIDRVELTGIAPSAREFAEGICLGTPLRFDIEQRGDLASTVHAVADAMTARFGTGEVSGRLTALLVSAVPG